MLICGETKHSSDIIHEFRLRKQQVFCGQKWVHLVKGSGHCDNPADSVAMYTLWMPKVYLKTTGVFGQKNTITSFKQAQDHSSVVTVGLTHTPQPPQ